MFRVVVVALQLVTGFTLVVDRAKDPVKLAADAQANSGGYFWSTIHGNGKQSVSAPFDISKPTWSWHDERGLWSTIPVGTLIDDKKDIYLTTADGIRKFTPDGALLWSYSVKHSDGAETIHQGASLWNGHVYCYSKLGRAFAVSMETGEELWSTKFANGSDGNYGHAAAHDGILLVAGEASANLNRETPSCCGAASHKLVGLNATDGSIIWTFRPDIPIWGANPSFAQDGTFIYQNLEGTVYRNRLADGSLVWKAGGEPGTWTDGSATLGPNDNLVYGTSLSQNFGPGPGYLSAYRFSDGHLVWKIATPRPPNQAPVVGRLAGRSGLSVVLPMGMQCVPLQRMDVMAFDAETGAQQWVFEGPTLLQLYVAGDIEGVEARQKAGIQPMTMPHPFGAASIDANGTVYVGSETGHFLALRDQDKDGRVSGVQEVSSFDTKAAFVGSSGPAFAPGILAVGSLNQLYVWRF